MNSINTTHLKWAASKKAVFLPSPTAFMTFKKRGEIGIQFQDHGYFSIVSHVGSLCVQERPFSASKRLIITTTHFEDLHFSDPVDKDIPKKKNVLQFPGASYTLKFSGHNPWTWAVAFLAEWFSSTFFSRSPWCWSKNKEYRVANSVIWSVGFSLIPPQQLPKTAYA